MGIVFSDFYTLLKTIYCCDVMKINNKTAKTLKTSQKDVFEKNLMALSGESKKVVFHALLSHQDAGLAPSTAAAEINTSLYFHL